MTMHYLEPSCVRANYLDVRRETLNFEASGPEHHVTESTASATPAQVPAQVLAFPGATRSWITVNIHRKDIPMTDSPNEGFTERRMSKSSGTSEERVETYSPTGPLHVRVVTQSGDIMVRASDSPKVEVTLRASSPEYGYLLDSADVIFDPASNTLTIRTLPKGVSISSRGLRIGPPRSWFDSGSSDIDVRLEVPRGTSVDATTVSGDTTLIGSLGVVSVKSVSGDVIARDTSDALDVQTASGDVVSGHVLTSLKCKSSSGDVVCQGAAVDTEIMSASGDVVLSADQPGKIVVRNVSGDVVVRVVRGLAVDISGNTVSGSLDSNIDLDADGDSPSDEELVIKVTTVSGDIRIAKAS
jgi:DUF4097 and DUF4098 domain-containing protein YvlB